ncbi:MAG TPA: DUF1266 domain-containing protein [Nannocystaceae bacterium]|nr:DUF1266 domain-containing protein [Nannocystaceae bacterium]
MIAALPRWGIALLGLLAAVALAWAIARLRAPDPERVMRERLEADARDPFKRWVQSVFLIVTGNCDYAHLPRAEALRILMRWWEIHGPVEHGRTLASLSGSGRPDNAWDLVRFVLVARLGVAAGWIAEDASWQAIAPIARRLQRAYPDWSAMAQGYVLARRQARGLAPDGTEDDGAMAAIRDNIAHLRDGRWRELPFTIELGALGG